MYRQTSSASQITPNYDAPKRIAFIGLGKQNMEDHLEAASKNDKVKIVAVCDSNEAAAQSWGTKLGVPPYTDYRAMIKACPIDAAIVAVPHHEYFDIVDALAKEGIHIFKEKPLAMTLAEAEKMVQLARSYKVILMVAAQRRHSKIYQKYAEYATQIGDIFSIHGEYTLNIQDLGVEWRSSRALAGGGAVLDMGYHLIDLIVWYFGVPARVSGDLGYHNRVDQQYDVEDTAKIQFSYKKGERRIVGSLLISRIYPQKDEGLFIYGMNGAIKIFKDRIELYDNNRELLESYFVKPNGDAISAQFNEFVDLLDSPEATGNYAHHLKNMAFIEAIYLSDKESLTIMPKEMEAVMQQRSKHLELSNRGDKS